MGFGTVPWEIALPPQSSHAALYFPTLSSNSSTQSPELLKSAVSCGWAGCVVVLGPDQPCAALIPPVLYPSRAEGYSVVPVDVASTDRPDARPIPDPYFLRRSAACSVVVSSHDAIVIGGMDDAGNVLDTSPVFLSVRWKCKAALQLEKRDHADSEGVETGDFSWLPYIVSTPAPAQMPHSKSAPCPRSFSSVSLLSGSPVHSEVSSSDLPDFVLTGGFDGIRATSDCWVWKWSTPHEPKNPRRSGTWSFVGPTPGASTKWDFTARIGHASAALSRSRILVFGGMNNDVRFADLLVVDVAAGSASSARLDTDYLAHGDHRDRGPSARAGHSFTRIGNSCWIMIGGDNGTSLLDDVWLLECRKRPMQSVSMPTAEEPTDCSDDDADAESSQHSDLEEEDEEEEFQDAEYSLDDLVFSWIFLGNIAGGCRSEHACCLIGNGALFIQGGNSGQSDVGPVSVLGYLLKSSAFTPKSSVRLTMTSRSTTISCFTSELWTKKMLSLPSAVEQELDRASAARQTAAVKLDVLQKEFDMMSIERDMKEAILRDRAERLRETQTFRQAENNRLLFLEQRQKSVSGELKDVAMEMERLRLLLQRGCS
eukprot:ANDGO_07556.mRNA.1 hypothetical protein